MSRSKWNNIDLDDDEAVDAYQDAHYRIKQHNERKSLLPLFVYLIIRGADIDHPLRQQEIMDRLRKEYEIEVSRGTLARTIHTLEGAALDIERDSRGVWYNGRPW